MSAEDYLRIYNSEASYASALGLYKRSLEDCPVAHESVFYETVFGRTHVVVSGPRDAVPLVILHGWNGNASGFHREYPFLLNRARLYAVDVIGQTGLSAPVRLSTTNADYVLWFESLLDAMELHSPNVLGFSGGGWITLKMLACSQNRLGRAALLSTVGLSGYTAKAALYSLLASALKQRWAIERFGSLQVVDPQRKPKEFEEFISYLVPQFRFTRPPSIPLPMRTEELRGVHTPVLLLMGEYERIVRPLSAIRRAKATIPGLENAELVAGAAHLLTFDRPEAINEHLTSFFGLST